MKKRIKNLLKSRKSGVTIVEVVVGVSIAAIMFLAIYGALGVLGKMNTRTNDKISAYSEIRNITEHINNLEITSMEVPLYLEWREDYHAFDETGTIYEKHLDNNVVIRISNYGRKNVIEAYRDNQVVETVYVWK